METLPSPLRPRTPPLQSHPLLPHPLPGPPRRSPLPQPRVPQSTRLLRTHPLRGSRPATRPVSKSARAARQCSRPTSGRHAAQTGGRMR
eukprot:1281625-Prymnesium_polylepis.1